MANEKTPSQNKSSRNSGKTNQDDSFDEGSSSGGEIRFYRRGSKGYQEDKSKNPKQRNTKHETTK